MVSRLWRRVQVALVAMSWWIQGEPAAIVVVVVAARRIVVDLMAQARRY